MQFQHLTFLGTSSGVPTVHRNVSSSVLAFATGAQWMFDCGEGTQQQMLRCPGVSAGKLERILVTHLHGDHSFGLPGLMCSMSMHWTPQGAPAPARAGKPGAAAAVPAADDDGEAAGPPAEFLPFKRNQEYLELVGPAPLAAFIRGSLAFSDSHFPYRYRVTELLPPADLEPLPGHRVAAAHTANGEETLHSCEAPPVRLRPNAVGVYAGLLRTPEGVSVDAAVLSHRIFCVGYALTEPSKPGALDMAAASRLGVPKGPLLAQLKAGKPVSFTPTGASAPVTVDPSAVVSPTVPGGKLLYLGDTCNSDRAAGIGAGARVVVHEATFDDSQAALAEPRGHSTARMAGVFAATVRAERLVLTHFSARYLPRAKDPTHMLRLESEAAEGAASVKGVTTALAVQAVDDFTSVDLKMLKRAAR